MSLRNNKKKDKKEEKRAFVDILRSDDFEAYVNFLKSPGKTFFFSFLRGTGFGLGTIFGTAIILAVIVYIFSLFVGVPILGEWVGNILNNLKK